MAKRLPFVVTTLVLLLGINDLILLSTSRVPLLNRAYRVLYGAPAVHIDGQLLMFSGAAPAAPEYLEPVTDSDEGIRLYRVRETPDGSQYLLVPRPGALSYRYQRPRPPWR